MATAVETLEKLERRVTLSVPVADVNAEVEKRLKIRARSAKAPGFRPGKVPMKMVAAQYGYTVENEVLNDKIGRAFAEATAAHNLRVAGFPKIEAKADEKVEGAMVFEATFEVYPEVKIDGVEFAGGKADDFVFVLGEGRMLAEFEKQTLGMKVGEAKTFSMDFPADYHGKDVAGKTAEFTITLKKLEWAHLPEVDAEFAKSLGVADGDIQKMRADVRANLEREVGSRVKARTKSSVMDALIKVAELDVPKALLDQDAERLAEMTREDMRQRGMDVKNMPFPPELFTSQADRRVRLGLILAEMVKSNGLQATAEQIKAHVDEFAHAYEDPQQVIKYYYSDRNRLAEVEALVLEENVVTYVLGKAKVTEKSVAFDELMGNNAQA